MNDIAKIQGKNFKMKYYHLKCNLKVVFQQEKKLEFETFFFCFLRKAFFISQWFNVHVS